MDKAQILQFVSEQKTAFVASVNEEGYPVVCAMPAPRKNQIRTPLLYLSAILIFA